VKLSLALLLHILTGLFLWLLLALAMFGH